MRRRLLSFLVPTLLLVFSLFLAACGTVTPPSSGSEQPAAAPPTAMATATAAATTATGQKQPAATPSGPKAPPSEYLPAFGCLPAITITDVVVQACLNKPEPTQFDNLQITTRMSKDGLPIAGAPVKTTWNYKTTRSECATSSNAQGIGFCYRNIGAATLGFRVTVEVQYDYNGQGYRSETSFTPARAGEPPAAAVPPTSTALPPKKIAPPVAQVPTGVHFTSVQGGRPGAYASTTVQTEAGANCSITYITPHGTVSTAVGLVSKTANGAGIVSWSWKIGTNTYAGTGEVDVTCNGASDSASITIG